MLRFISEKNNLQKNGPAKWAFDCTTDDSNEKCSEVLSNMEIMQIPSPFFWQKKKEPQE